jgi:epoxyqueuosine reductase
VRQLRAWGHECGFSQIGISGIDLGSAEAGLRQWLAAGFHGGMDYMARHGFKRARPAELVPGTVSVITARLDYLSADAPAAWRRREQERLAQPGEAVISIYARGRDYHKVVRARLLQLAARLAEAVGPFGHRVFTDSAPVLEVELATRAGLAWRGKHTLALARDAGSTFFLGEIFVDFALPATDPAGDHCGSCTRCIAACPTGAIVAPYRLDARRCISYLTIEHHGPIPIEWRSAIGNRVFGCDDCQLVCPWNKFARRSTLPDFDVRHGLDGARLIDLWHWSEAEFFARTEGSALRRIGWQRWRRNLAVASGNALRQGGKAGLAVPLAAELAAGVAAELAAARESADALVREHIDWALAPQAKARSAASASGNPAIASTVDNVTSPATKPPCPPSRTAST